MSHNHNHENPEDVRCELCARPIGYHGQRYEIRFRDHEGKEEVMGWTQRKPHKMLAACKLWPRVKEAWIVDLLEGKVPE